ncbi:MAG: ABC transporter ATP-binding protein [Calditrichaeota bacterium]|nr:MAG: ABC transporter ATP-binding protein [Calditrichota bacterium]
MKERNISVKTNGLTRRFGNFTAVDGVSIEVYEQEIFGFLGANGAGKTTLIRMLCGLLLPTEGEAYVAGYDVYREVEQIKRHIGYMSQRFSLYNDLTPSENIEFYGGIYGLTDEEIKHRKQELLSQVGLEEYADKLTRELPLGFKQRLALGCALLHNPPIVFLDEPTSGVDPEARREFWDLIHRTAAQGKTVFVTTHFMEEAEYCHRVMMMQEGKVIALDTPGRLKERYQKSTMQEVFVALEKTVREQNRKDKAV